MRTSSSPRRPAPAVVLMGLWRFRPLFRQGALCDWRWSLPGEWVGVGVTSEKWLSRGLEFGLYTSLPCEEARKRRGG